MSASPPRPPMTARRSCAGPIPTMTASNFTAERWPPWRQGMEYDAGLFFICYQRDPRTGFIKIFDKMAKLDMMNQFVTHVGGGLFACPRRRGGRRVHRPAPVREHMRIAMPLVAYRTMRKQVPPIGKVLPVRYFMPALLGVSISVRPPSPKTS